MQMVDLNKKAFKVQNILLSYGFYILLVLFVLFFSIVSESFLTASNWTQISIVACFLLTASAGLTTVIITGNIDLSLGSVAYVAAAMVYVTSEFPPAVSILVGIAAGIVAGLINGVLVSHLRMNSLLTTLGILIAYRGISLVITGGTVRPVSEGLRFLGSIKFFNFMPLVFLIGFVVMIVLQTVLSKTKFGAYCYAIGNSEQAADRIGIPVKTVKTVVFVISGTCGAISGILLPMYLGEVTTFTGRGMEFEAVAAVVIGGTSLFGGRGNVLPGTFAGALLLIIINNGLGTIGVSPYIYPFVAGVVIFLAIYLDSLKNLRRSSRFQ
jgi:ribose/xylose/arabinose/galactoside ABC-type transport system permease subunit